jgi:prepilin-type N-terminal cleavage/methylation domain-containing protein
MINMKKQSGFTLVEIAIVLVIIGLLLGGVLKGQELINSAKVKNIANDLRSVSTFIYAYQDKFKALPGDDPLVVNHVGAAATANATLCSAPNPSPCAGDARINGAWNAAATSESFLFWQHVRMANLASGTPDTTSGEYLPRNADGGPLGITGDPVSTVVPNPWPANFYVCTAGVQGRFARQIDTTIDDGNTSTGTVRVIGTQAGGTLANSATFYTVTPADDATLYTVCVAN